MAGFKHRYIVLEIESNLNESFKSKLKDILYLNLKDNFGDLVLSKIDNFEISEFYENLQIAILKCNLEIYKYLCYTIVTIGKVNSLNVHFKIVAVSGIIKKAKVMLLKYINRKQTE